MNVVKEKTSVSPGFMEQAEKWRQNFEKHQKQHRPKEHFKVILEGDFKHAQGLEKYLESMRVVGEKLAQKKNRSAKEEMELCRLTVETNEIVERLNLHQKIIHDKVKHFNDIFIPFYEERLDEVRKKWSKLFDYAQRYIEGAHDSDVRKQRLKKYVNEYNLLPTEEQQDVEVQARYFVDFKNITGWKG
jgi:predicted DNA-binding protein YlxM (UPF0122 family)